MNGIGSDIRGNPTPGRRKKSAELTLYKKLMIMLLTSKNDVSRNPKTLYKYPKTLYKYPNRGSCHHPRIRHCSPRAGCGEVTRTRNGYMRRGTSCKTAKIPQLVLGISMSKGTSSQSPSDANNRTSQTLEPENRPDARINIAHKRPPLICRPPSGSNPCRSSRSAMFMPNAV
jgi:hypothetical protein